MRSCDIQIATHVKGKDQKIHRIGEKWGIDLDSGAVNKPSEGGFGTVTLCGQRIGMEQAQRYYRAEPHDPDAARRVPAIREQFCKECSLAERIDPLEAHRRLAKSGTTQQLQAEQLRLQYFDALRQHESCCESLHAILYQDGALPDDPMLREAKLDGLAFKIMEMGQKISGHGLMLLAEMWHRRHGGT